MNIYIAGPMRGYDGFNFPAFFAAEAALREVYPDAEIVNPARDDLRIRDVEDEWLAEDPTGLAAGRRLEKDFGDKDLREALATDLLFVARYCDLVVLLPGWGDSKGASAEAAAADAVGIEILPLNEALAGLADSTRPQSPAERGERLSEALVKPAAPSKGEEVRRTSASGGQKGVKAAQFDQIPPLTLTRLAEHFGKGAAKYDAHNFRKGYPWSYSYNALMRHLMAFWGGEDYDVCPADGTGCKHEVGQIYVTGTCFNHTGSHHLDAAMWHAHVLTIFFEEHKEYDDRYGIERPTA